MVIFDPYKIDTPQLTDHQKLSEVITSTTSTAIPNLVHIRARVRAFWVNWVKYNQFIYLFMPLFGNSPTSQTRRRIFARNGSSNDADSSKNVPFGVSLIWLPIYKAKPPKPQFWGREYAFSSQTREIKKHAYYRN